MTIDQIFTKVQNKIRRLQMEHLSKKKFVWESDKPYISFTFDDYPISSLERGGKIMEDNGFRATYYLAFGLLNSDSPSGKICGSDLVLETVERGHELGCHTFSHVNTWKSPASEFENSLQENKTHLNNLLPNYKFRSHAYPFGNMTPSTKSIAGRFFRAARGGGQTFNRGSVDLNNLQAYFLDRRLGDSPAVVKKVIDQTVKNNGWLIFATHDITESPSPFGNSIQFLEKVAQYAGSSGAEVFPVGEVLEKAGLPA